MHLNRLCFLIAPIGISFLFSFTLTGRDRLAFRDVSHFYTPLYGYVADRSADQWLPLWNPLDQTGVPLLGESTTAVLYPVRIAIYMLPLSSEQAMAFYVVSHLILATFTASWLAMQAGATRFTAPLAGLTYVFSGSVFFLYTNPPFLVGAAWLPLLLGVLILQSREMSLQKRALIGSFAMSMMVLAGDPQCAVHACMVTMCVTAVRFIHGRWFTRKTIHREVWSNAIVLASSCALALMLAFPQIAASLSWSSQSERVKSAESIDWYSPPSTGSLRDKSYHFSMPPWHLTELVTSNAWGSLFPINQRISRSLPGDGRIWTPTIYVGMLGLLALVGRLMRWRRSGVDLWSALAVIAILLSFGHFGVVWILQQIPGVLTQTDSAIGGAYWWLYQFVPGYSVFRYPVKWLPFVSLACAVLTSLLIEEWCNKGPSRDSPTQFAFPRSSIATASALILICAGGLLAGKAILHVLQVDTQLFADEYWGPIHFESAFVEIGRSLLHSTLTLILISGIVFCARRRTQGIRFNIVCAIICLIVVVELGGAMRPHLATANVIKERDYIHSMVKKKLAPDMVRCFRAKVDSGWPSEWSRSHDEDRITQVAAAERASGFGRWHLERRVNAFNNMLSIRSHRYAEFWVTASALAGDLDPPRRARFWSSIHSWLGINCIVLLRPNPKSPIETSLPAVEFSRVSGQPVEYTTDFQFVGRIDGPHEVYNCQNLLKEIEDESHVPWVEAVEVRESIGPVDSSVTEEYVSPNAEERILLTRPTFQDGHWAAHASSAIRDETISLPVHSVDFLKQGVVLPPGKWKVTFSYAPWWVTPALVIAALGWTVWLGCTTKMTITHFGSAKANSN